MRVPERATASPAMIAPPSTTSGTYGSIEPMNEPPGCAGAGEAVGDGLGVGATRLGVGGAAVAVGAGGGGVTTGVGVGATVKLQVTSWRPSATAAPAASGDVKTTSGHANVPRPSHGSMFRRNAS